eukprot:COSAG05_NODE_1489_length_4725_cov_10.311933_3_plen_141_part_00
MMIYKLYPISESASTGKNGGPPGWLSWVGRPAGWLAELGGGRGWAWSRRRAACGSGRGRDSRVRPPWSIRSSNVHRVINERQLRLLSFQRRTETQPESFADLATIAVYPYLAGLLTWTAGIVNASCRAAARRGSVRSLGT